jgi:arginase
MEKLTLVIPQWQGGGQSLGTYHGAFALRDFYLGRRPCVTVEVGTDDIAPVEQDILGYRDILNDMDRVNAAVAAARPRRIFTLGGGCDADAPCAAWLNKVYGGDMAIVYVDAHGDLNTPPTSDSKLYYGMSLRALVGDSAPEVISRLASTATPDQLVMCANRTLDPEELRYKAESDVYDLTVDQIVEDPACVGRAVAEKGFSHSYVHVDLDSLDPAEFGLTPVPEPHGLTREALLGLVRDVAESVEVVGLGILEYCGTAADRGDRMLQELVDFGASL